MAVKLKKVARFLEGTKELAIFVQDDHMTEPKFQLNLHNGCGK